MKGILFHIMMFSRKPIILISKLLIGFFVIASIMTFIGMFITKTNFLNLIVLTIMYLSASFIIYLFVDRYDRILMKIKPKDIDLTLFR